MAAPTNAAKREKSSCQLGAAALCGIKEVGGVTIAQKLETAEQPDMPESAIASGCIDFVLSPEDIAQEMCELRRGTLNGCKGRRRRPLQGFLDARIGNDKCGNCQYAANDQHQENRPAQKTASRLDRRLYYLFSILMHRNLL